MARRQSRLARVAGDSLATAIGVQFSSVGWELQSPYRGSPIAVIDQLKQRAASNGLPSFRMWKQARANLCASALVATTGLVRAFLRS